MLRSEVPCDVCGDGMAPDWPGQLCGQCQDKGWKWSVKEERLQRLYGTGIEWLDSAGRWFRMEPHYPGSK